jgi:hypothetical protein
MSEEKINYQWIKGEKMGTVESFLKEEAEGGMSWTYFESGRRINSSMISEFLIALPPGEIPMEMEISKETSPSSLPIQNEKKEKKREISPIRSLLERQKNPKIEKIQVQVELEIPSKDLFSVLEETFGREEMIEEIKNLSLEKISMEFLSEKAKEQIQQFINKYYDNQ